MLREIVSIVNGPISAEVTSTDHEEMLDQGRELAQDPPQHRGQGAADPRGAAVPASAAQRGHQGQRDALLLAEPGAAGRQGRRDLHQPVHRPARRHLPRRDGADPSDPRDLRQLRLRDRDPRRLDPPPAARRRGGAGRRRRRHHALQGRDAAAQAPADRHRPGEVPGRLEEAQQKKAELRKSGRKRGPEQRSKRCGGATPRPARAAARSASRSSTPRAS